MEEDDIPDPLASSGQEVGNLSLENSLPRMVEVWIDSLITLKYRSLCMHSHQIYFQIPGHPNIECLCLGHGRQGYG